MDAFAAVELHLAAAEVDLDHLGPAPQVDLDPLVELRVGVHAGDLAALLAAQVLLRQRRALIRAVTLRAEQHDAAVEALLAQRLGRLGARHASAHDHERVLWASRVSRDGRSVHSALAARGHGLSTCSDHREAPACNNRVEVMQCCPPAAH